jgi:hypothetical protein
LYHTHGKEQQIKVLVDIKKQNFVKDSIMH